MRNLKKSATALVALISLSTLTGCFLEDSVSSGIADGITSGLATVVEDFIVSSVPAGGEEE